jgi:hypothetical protein
MGINRALGELAFIAIPSLDPAPMDAPQWAKRLRVSLKLLKRRKREAKPYAAPRRWPTQSGAELRAAVLAQQAANNAMFQHQLALMAASQNASPQAANYHRYQQAAIQQSALARLQNAYMWQGH